jgi:hypothetical protein
LHTLPRLPTATAAAKLEAWQRGLLLGLSLIAHRLTRSARNAFLTVSLRYQPNTPTFGIDMSNEQRGVFNMKHAPLPWNVCKGTNGFTETWQIEFKSPMRHMTVADCGAVMNRHFHGSTQLPAGISENIENRKTAEFIVRACNSHYELLDAASNAMLFIQRIAQNGQALQALPLHDKRMLELEYKRLSQAIANATKE